MYRKRQETELVVKFPDQNVVCVRIDVSKSDESDNLYFIHSL